MKRCLWVVVTVICASVSPVWLAVWPAHASLGGASIAVSKLTYVPTNLGNTTKYHQVITFDTALAEGTDTMDITVPDPLRQNIQDFVFPQDPGGVSNRCSLSTDQCTVVGSGTLTIVYGAAWGYEPYPTSPITVGASLRSSAISATGTVTVAPNADVAIQPGRSKLRTDVVVGNLGPSRSGPITLTLSGFDKPEPVLDLPSACAWQGAKLVCQYGEIWPDFQLTDLCPAENTQIFVNCHELNIYIDTTWSGTLTAQATGSHPDINTSNNRYSFQFGTPAPTGGGSGGQHSPVGGAGSSLGGVSVDPSFASSAEPVPSSNAPISTNQGVAGSPVVRVSSGLQAVVWPVVAVAAAMLAAAGYWIVRRRRRPRT